MEDGSLLHEALQSIQQNRESLRNRLIVDLFLLDDQTSTTERFQSLVSLCSSLNSSNKNDAYPWFAGGDGPVYGIHVTEGIPHVRGLCYYGPSVQDEWHVVAQLLQFSGASQHNVATKVWDADDGQLLLIESALVLPAWVDEIGPVACEHACWILDGQVTLIRPNAEPTTALTLPEALSRLRDNVLEQPEEVQAAIARRIAPLKEDPLTQRTAVVLPRKVAVLLEQIPSLLHSSVASFEQHAAVAVPKAKTIEFSDLQWTTQRLGRTSYALLRNLQTSVWNNNSSIPPVFKSPEVIRMKRTCQVESTPHLNAALELGIRIVAGLEYAINNNNNNNSTISEVGAEERILNHWTALDVASGGDGVWLQHAWMAGPNASPVDLSLFLKCPIASLDLNAPFPISFPGKTLKEIVQQNLNKKPSKELSFVMPGPNDVDNDEWMHLKGDEQELDKFLVSGGGSSDQDATEDENKRLGKLLEDVETFVDQESDIKGVATNTEKYPPVANLDQPVNIDEGLFLNLLHKVLTSTPEEITNLTTEEDEGDLYFSKEDYDMTADEDEENRLREMMTAMDLELQSHSKASRGGDPSVDNPDVAQDAKVLSGLLDSLEASEGSAGPVRNLISEMSKDKPT